MVVSIVSVTFVLAGAGLNVKFSKPPPLAAMMVLLTAPASIYTSSLGAGRLTVPVVLPGLIVMVCPPLKVTVTAVLAALLSVAV